jgi:glycerol uptake facilitator-like aquaporin
MILFITTAVKTSNPTYEKVSCEISLWMCMSLHLNIWPNFTHIQYLGAMVGQCLVSIFTPKIGALEMGPNKQNDSFLNND